MKIIVLLLIASPMVLAIDEEGSGNIDSISVNESMVYKQVCVQADAGSYCTVVAIDTATDN